MLTQKIQDDLVASLKAKEQDRVDVLRLMRSEIQNAEIEKSKPLDDKEVIVLLQKNVKKLREAAEMFKEGGRNDLVKQNEAQIEIIGEYLPAELSDEELGEAVDAIIKENAELSDKNPKAIIGIVMKELSGQADSKRILDELKSRESPD